jgi:hypothetical protein
LALSAQVQIEANVDSVAILVGEQTRLNLSVTAKEGSKVIFPKFKPSQYITPGVEVLEQTGDTMDADNDMKKMTMHYTLTSFDEHLYAIPAMSVKVDGKTYKTNTLALKVITIPVDTVHPGKFFPPKDVQDNPFLWSEWSGMFWLSILMILIIGAAMYMYIRLKQNKPIITHIKIVKHIPPHQRALNAIEKIKEEKMQTSEDQKTYYTRLTDTLRQYIEERFGFRAMEMTSSDIIFHLKESGDQKMIAELTELFQTADLVKFAKYSTLINENDLNLVNAVNFIDQTKTDSLPTEERIVPQLSEGEQQARKSRITIKWVMWGCIVAAIALLVYVVYNLYLLI